MLQRKQHTYFAQWKTSHKKVEDGIRRRELLITAAYFANSLIEIDQQKHKEIC